MVWNEKLDVGVDAMNEQHQVLIEIMNRLHDQFQAGVGKLQQKKTIEELQKYTVKHFSLEEQYLASIDYPKLEAHKLIHASLLEEFGEHVAAFKKSGELTSKFFSFLKLWLTAHIQGIDMKYGPKA